MQRGYTEQDENIVMYFRDPKKELPSIYTLVLIKFSYSEGIVNYEGYNFCYLVETNIGKVFLSDDGLYDEYSLDRVIGWLPLSELDSIEIK